MFAKNLMVFTMLAGVLVFLAAETQGHHLLREFRQSGISVAMLLLATLLCPVLWFFLNRRANKTLFLRIGISVQITAIMIGWFYIQYPVLIQIKGGEHLTFFNTRAPDATLEQLLIALIVGLIFVIPGFIYLFKVFKVER
jgi:cytochrome d ubiquinol oxidase subunit II